jgi:hypothetical protein
MSNNCKVPDYDKMSKDEKDASTKKMLQAAGITACKTSNTQAAFASQMKSLLGSVQVGGSASTTNTIGCEQVIAASKKYIKAVQDITCNVIKSSQSVKSSASAQNSIIFKPVSVCGDPSVDPVSYKEVLMRWGPEGCKSNLNISGDVNIKQVAKIDYVSKISLSENAKAQIIEKSKDVLETALGVNQDSKTGAGATPQGSKVLNELTSVSKSQSLQQAITDTAKSISMEVTGGNTIVFSAPGDVNLQNVNITQDSLLKLVAENLMSSAMKFMSNKVKDSIQKSNDEIKQKAVNTAPPSALDMFKSNGMWYVIGGIVVLIIIIILFSMFSRRSSNSNSNSNSFKGLAGLATSFMKKMKK